MCKSATTNTPKPDDATVIKIFILIITCLTDLTLILLAFCKHKDTNNFQNASYFKDLYMEIIKKRSDCPLSSSLDIFGDKWSLLIIRDLVFGNKFTYNDFLRSEEGIATNILASRLKGLEENGIIEKSTHPDSKAKKLYKLTQKGINLLPIIVEIYIWSDMYLNVPPEIKNTINEAKKNKTKFIKQMTGNLKKTQLH